AKGEPRTWRAPLSKGLGGMVGAHAWVSSVGHTAKAPSACVGEVGEEAQAGIEEAVQLLGELVVCAKGVLGLPVVGVVEVLRLGRASYLG
ncbi:unnamed protein product, partial [Ilex paraguariensis]